MKKRKVEKGVIIVAGRGTRFLPVTKSLPKEMLPILDKPVLQFIVEEMAKSGIKSILFVTSSQKRPIEDHFDRDYSLEKFLEEKGKGNEIKDLIHLSKEVQFFYTRQAKPLGNGHALLMAEKFVGDESFAFSDGDSVIDSEIPVTKQLIDVFNKTGTSVLGVKKVEEKENLGNYGNVHILPIKNKNYFQVKEIIEKPSKEKFSKEHLIIAGMRYIFNKDIWPKLEKQTSGHDNEIWLADAANNLAKSKKLLAYEYSGKYFDTGNKKSMLEAILYFAKKENII